ncbi:hypothetical protein ACQPYV_22755 [Micromonospora saelicesensis]|uniref:hypothetical protein n=1 Tax=Micromonospora saelicesensis TaxID=285676 RepID=UPI003D9472B2
MQAVQSTVIERPGERFYGAVLGRIYREAGGQLGLPNLAMNSVEALAQLWVEKRADVRRSAVDWDH